MQAKYVHRGESLNYLNATGAMIPAGDVVPLVSRIGIAGGNIPENETGAVHVIGVFRMIKTGAAAIPMGTAVYFDGTGITAEAASGSVPAGYAAEDAGAADETILVKLLG